MEEEILLEAGSLEYLQVFLNKNKKKKEKEKREKSIHKLQKNRTRFSEKTKGIIRPLF